MNHLLRGRSWSGDRIYGMWWTLWRTQPHIGEYKLTNRDEDFEGFLLCDGRALDREEYHHLFAVVGNTYGPPPSDTTFRLPDFRGRVLGATAASGLRVLGNATGSETITLTVPQLPPHTHTGTTEASGTHSHAHNANGGSQGLVTMNGQNTIVGGGTDNSGNELNLTTPPVALDIQNSGSHTHGFTTNATGSGAAVSVMQPTLFGVNVFIFAGWNL